ncbi:protein translocase subunit SecF [Candidatus Poribacteria bacterium]|nr:protein translocase subunit SecF [Candidatus Poribacteria bacterium]
MEFFHGTNFDFMKFKYKAYLISGLLILAGLVSMIINRGLKYGVDFEGGTLLEVKFEKNVKIDEIRNVLSKINLGDSIIQQYGSEKDILIRARNGKVSEKEGSMVGKKIEIALKENFDKVNSVQVRREEYVGPIAGQKLTSDTLIAVLISIIGILIYVSWRFEFKYAFGGVIALVHDVLITLGFFSIFNREISIQVIAAILTLIGYSINDTIVVFDRIRETLPMFKKKNISFPEVINISINSTLGRTVNTSMTTLVSVLAILFFGGEILRDFSLALSIGIITGTYSSIYIASPLLIDWEKFSKK